MLGMFSGSRQKALAKQQLKTTKRAADQIFSTISFRGQVWLRFHFLNYKTPSEQLQSDILLLWYKNTWQAKATWLFWGYHRGSAGRKGLSLSEQCYLTALMLYCPLFLKLPALAASKLLVWYWLRLDESLWSKWVYVANKEEHTQLQKLPINA